MQKPEHRLPLILVITVAVFLGLLAEPSAASPERQSPLEQELEARLETIWNETRVHGPLPENLADPILTDDYVGGGYAVIGSDELALQVAATRMTGMLFDPVYTGKALYGLRREIGSGRLDGYDDIIFWHTGGGFGVFAHDFSGAI